MPRYIDADALKTDILMKYKRHWEVPCSSEDRLIQSIVTDLRVLIERNVAADVVPKSEVDKWVCKCGDWHEVAELKSQRIVELEAELSKAKSEVAREIFAELVSAVYYKIPDKILPITIAEMSNPLGYEDGLNFGSRNAYFDTLKIIAELKKKYTEGASE